MDNEAYFLEASEEAKKALCEKAKCGAVVVLGDRVVGRGYNAPPKDNKESCKCSLQYSEKSLKPKSDRTCCVHAEWRAIVQALKQEGDIDGADFARVDNDGEMLFSGKPYCTVCSRLALDVGIRKFFLWHEEGMRGYDTKEYNDVSYKFHE